MGKASGMHRISAAIRAVGWLVVVVTVALAATTAWAWWIFVSGGAILASIIFGIAWVIDGFAAE